jgi:hypothetical protein
MSITWSEDGKPNFSEDHQYKSIIWLVNDAANVPFLNYIDREKVFALDLAGADYKKLRAAAAIYIAPRIRDVHLERIDRTLYWGSSTLHTSDTLSRMLDIGITSMLENLKPDVSAWEARLTDHGAQPFMDIDLLRSTFPELLAREGERIGSIITQRAAGLQAGKATGHCSRGDGRYELGTAAMFTLIGPLMGAAIAHITGSWPERPLAASDIFELTFIGEKLESAKHLWIELESGTTDHPVS